jgi:hypothetical protein
MLDKHNTDEITKVDNTLQIAGACQNRPSQEPFPTTKSEDEPGTKAQTNDKREGRDAAIKAQEPESQGIQVIDNDYGAGNPSTENQVDDKPFSVFIHNEKRIIVISLASARSSLQSPVKYTFPRSMPSLRICMYPIL